MTEFDEIDLDLDDLDFLNLCESAGESLESILNENKDLADEISQSHLEKTTKELLSEIARLSSHSENWRDRHRLELWLAHSECTMRGIPPVLRDAQDADEREWESAMDVLSADLAWLASEYPNHQTIFAKWRGIFKPETFHQSCMFLGESLRRRKIHWICRFLNLTVGQQREMFFLKRDGLRGEFAGINERKKPVMRALVEAYQRREDQYKIGGKVAIKRQFSIWLCGSVASWKPQRTADFFGALMGHKITRQNANRIIKKVWQDVPETNPKNKIKKSTF